jgi:hypothetical protein
MKRPINSETLRSHVSSPSISKVLMKVGKTSFSNYSSVKNSLAIHSMQTSIASRATYRSQSQIKSMSSPTK